LQRISAEQLSAISRGDISLEQAFAQSLSFQDLDVVSKSFAELDRRIDIFGWLSKPHRRRKVTLFMSLKEMVSLRHNLIHKADIYSTTSDAMITRFSQDMEISVTRIYKNITNQYRWSYEKWWHAGEA
jgi:hypothetical protein